MKEEDIKPSLSNNTEVNFDSKSSLLQSPEGEFDEDDARFNKSLLELKGLSSQLHFAADHWEMSFLRTKQKKAVMENTKEYICRAMVTVVDHLGNVSANLEGQLLGTKQFSDTELQINCLQQGLVTCREYAQKLALSKVCRSYNFPRHHTRYSSQPAPNVLEKSDGVLRNVTDSIVPKYHLAAEKEGSVFLYRYAHKPPLTKLSPAEFTCVNKLTTDSSSGFASGLRFPAVREVPFVLSIPKNPSFHFQETKKLGRKGQNRKSLQIPWKKSYKIH